MNSNITFIELLEKCNQIYDSRKWYYSGNEEVRYILGDKNIFENGKIGESYC